MGGITPPLLAARGGKSAATNATKEGGNTPYIPPMYPLCTPRNRRTGDKPPPRHFAPPPRSAPRGLSTLAQSAPKVAGVRAYGAPIWRALRADFGRCAPLLRAGRARNVPAFGGSGYEKPPQDLRGSFRAGGRYYRTNSKVTAGARQIACNCLSRLGICSRNWARYCSVTRSRTITPESLRSAPA